MASTTLADTPNSPSPIITLGYRFATRIVPLGYMHKRRVELPQPRRPAGRSGRARAPGRPLIITPPTVHEPIPCYKVRVTLEEINGAPVTIVLESQMERCYDDAKKPHVVARLMGHRIVAKSTGVIVRLRNAVARAARRLIVKAQEVIDDDEDPGG